MALSIGELVGYIDLDTSKAEAAAGSIGDTLGKLGGQWGKVLGAAGAAGGLVYGAGLVGAVNAEVGADKLAASLGKGEKAAQRYGEVAGAVYSNGFGAGLEDVNAAMGAVITSIKGMRNASDKEVQRMTEKAMTYADVMEVDVTRAAQVAGNMLANGMAKDGAQAFDILMKGSQKVPAQLREDVLDAMDEYGQFFNQLGMDGPAAMNLLAEGAEKGMYGIDKAGDALKEFTIRATDGSKSTVAAFESIGLDAVKMSNDILAGGDRAGKATGKIVDGLLGIKDPTQQAAAAIALFGTPLEDIGTKDIPKFLGSLQEGGDGLGKFKGAVDDAGKTAYDNASSNLTVFGRTLKTQLVETIGGSVLPKLTDLTGSLAKDLGPALDTAADAVRDTVGWFKDHSTASKVLAGVIGALVVVTAAHGAVLAVTAAGGMAAWLSQTKLISTATKVWTAIQWAMNAALAANPIGLVVVALAAIAAGLVIAYKKSETFRNVMDAGFEAVGKAATWLWNNALQPAFKFMVNGIASVLDMWSSMLEGLAKVPGFGWAKKAADSMANAAERARDMAEGIQKIPENKRVAVTVAYTYTGLKGGGGTTRGRGDDFMGGGTTPKMSAKAGSKVGKAYNDALGYTIENMGDGPLESMRKTTKRQAKKALETARERLAAAIDLRNQFRAATREAAVAFGSIVNTTADEAGQITGTMVVDQMRGKLAAIRQFRDNMTKLLRKGLDDASYRQMIADGVEKSGALAAALVQDDAAVKAVADLSGQIGAAADGLGRDASQHLHQAGVDSAQTLVDSLTSKRPELVDHARGIGDEMGRSLADALTARLADVMGALGDAVTPQGKGDQSGRGGKGKKGDGNRDRDSGRNGPLIGSVYASHGMNEDELAERLWFKTRTRG